ncbi:protein-glutamate methyltransferase [Belnapia sp. T6]|uniref:protein-glutamate O-methyltransferase n=1 Tax=Belnapia mucosa TaxID=2804532 RepID=A0ABS1V204_9PROT|nr:protein-glutamate O-methyltransferase CheR [Belnapia mucosa]MBL6455720.1 protein-glutamate methyltransferase [Belnapia mucosa]
MSPARSAAAFGRLKQAVIRRTGHFYYEDKDALLWERLARRFRTTGLDDSEAYLARLADPVQGEAEWAALEAEITIGETFFFRYAEQFAALRHTILPAIIAANRDQRRIRIWSAGCATGAEPHSVAILLRQLLGEAIGQWRISIIGTDINQAFLEAARRAEYGAWALRSIPPAERAEDFLPSADGKLWRLRPKHRALVRFDRQNLQSLLDGTAPLTFSDFDLILCRNVLIYFHPETVTEIVRALGQRLAPEGWMLLGHAEPNPAFTQFLRLTELPGTVAYRPRSATIEVVAPVFTPPPVSPMPPPPVPAPVVEARPVPKPVAPPPAPAPRPDPSELLAELRALANHGEPERAATLCRQGLAAEPMAAELHFYAGLLAWGRGDRAEAEGAFRRAIYLDTGFVMAHYQLGLLLLKGGDPAKAHRAIGNALSIARGLPDAAPLREGDGLTAAAFRDLARLQLASGRS